MIYNYSPEVNEVNVSNYRTLYGLQQWERVIMYGQLLKVQTWKNETIEKKMMALFIREQILKTNIKDLNQHLPTELQSPDIITCKTDKEYMTAK